LTRPIALVVAVAENGVIGGDNRLLWHLRTDLRHFRSLTLGRPVVMGRKTYDSIGRPLPGRETIILTRDPNFAAEGVAVAHDLADAVRTAEEAAGRLGADAIMVAGGSEIFALALPLAARIHLTEVKAAPAGDRFFPPVDPKLFRETRRESHPAGPEDDHPFTFVDYERRA
jgi:dihydrofolate reductase